MALRYGFDVWGKDAPRRLDFRAGHWREPLKWNKDARKAGERHRVFCGSMMDFFERNEALEQARRRVWNLIAETPYLDWLILTKRQDNAKLPWRDGEPWHNVWIGMSAGSQQYVDQRLPYLEKVNAVVRFISAEPLIGEVDISRYASRIDWIIGGGESGQHARAMDLNWARSLRDQCVEHKIAFHFKQWGNNVPLSQLIQIDGLTMPKTTTIVHDEETVKFRSKHDAGDWLDGKTWKESPTPRVGIIPACSEKAA
jgi:protein gp37